MTKYSYKQEFLYLGFTFIDDRGAVKPQCVLCCSVVERISEEKQIEKTSREEAPATCDKRILFTVFSTQRSGTETKPILLSNECSAFSLQASHAGIAYSRVAHSQENETAHDWRTAC